MSDDESQARLQDFGVDVAIDVASSGPICNRCGGEIANDSGDKEAKNRLEYELGYYDVTGEDETPDVCDDCADLQQFLERRHEMLTSERDVVGAVAVHCQCHDDDEIDVQPIRRGETASGRCCSQCGRSEVVIEKLPPSENPALPGDVR